MKTSLSPEMQLGLDSVIRFHTEQFRSLQEHENSKRAAAKGRPKFNPARLLIDLSAGNLNGENAEYLQEAAHRDGVAHDPVRPYLAFRDLYTALASHGRVSKYRCCLAPRCF